MNVLVKLRPHCLRTVALIVAFLLFWAGVQPNVAQRIPPTIPPPVVLTDTPAPRSESATPDIRPTATPRPPTRTPLPPTPTPPFTATAPPEQEGFIQSAAVLPAFPAAIIFRAVFDLPADEIDQVTLRVQTDDGAGGRASIQIPLALDEDAQIEGGSQYTGIWQFSPYQSAGRPPALFSTYTYTWSAETEAGETARYQQSAYFADPDARWLLAQDGAAGLTVASPDNFSNPERFLQLLRLPYTRIGAAAGEASQMPQRWLIYPQFVSGGCVRDDNGEPAAFAEGYGFVPCSPEVADFVLNASGWDLLSAPQDAARTDTALVGQFVQKLFRAAWGERADLVPAWFAEGLGLHFAPERDVNLLSQTQATAREERLFTLAELSEPPQQSEQDAWRAQSFGYVTYLADLLGYDGLYRFAASLGDVPFAQAYQQATGQSLDALPIEWGNWLFSPRAASAYGLSPYSPPTPTATYTATATLTLTPSLTPSLTSTATVSRTPTPITPSPPPTVTDTPSATPGEPTSTPRPPGSIPRALEPTPAPAVDQNTGAPAPGWVIIGLVALLLILIVAFIVVSRLDNTPSRNQ